jgi:hypothetical protein
MPDRGGLIPLDEVSRRLGLKGQSYAGIRAIQIERIIGTVDRSHDFDREFRLRRGYIGQRLASVRRAFPDGAFPPISVFEIGGSYFVSDGHKRVAVAREMGVDSIDAEVIRLETGYELPADVDIPQLIHTQQHRFFMEQTGLELVRPGARIEFSRPQGYRELLEIVKAHGFDLIQQAGFRLEPPEVAMRWYDEVYRPAVAALHREELPADYAYKTEADLFLCIYGKHRDLLVEDTSIDFAAAARKTRGSRVSRRFKRQVLRDKRTLLRRKPRRHAAGGVSRTSRTEQGRDGINVDP